MVYKVSSKTAEAATQMSWGEKKKPTTAKISWLIRKTEIKKGWLSSKEINLKHSTAYIINWYRSQLTVRSRKFFSVPILFLSCYRNCKAAYPKEYRFSPTWLVCVCMCAHVFVKGAQETRPTSNSICSLRTDLNSWPFQLCFLGSAITDVSYHSSLKPC